MAKKAFLETGRIVTTHGIHGEVKVEPWCDTPAMLAALERVYLDEQGQQELKVEQGAVYKRMVLLKLAGYDTIEQAQTLRGQVLFLNREDLDLPDGSYFVQDLLGCRVVDADRPALSYGRLVQVTQTGANDVYLLRDETGRERLVPAIPDVVIEIDLDQEQIKIRPLKGLFD